MYSSASRPVSPASLFLTLLTLFALLVTGGLAFAPAASADSADDVTRISLTPVPLEGEDAEGEDVDPNRVSFSMNLDPGATAEDAVRVHNFTDRDITVHLEAGDGLTTETGEFDIVAPGTPSEDSGTWIELDDTEVTVPAMDTVDVGFTVTVPDNATPGDHPAGITASAQAGDAEGVSFVARIGARLHLRVTGDIEPQFTVENLTVEHHYNWIPFVPGSTTTTWELHNTGNVRLGADQDVTVTGPFGMGNNVTELEEIREVLPGQSSQMTAENDGVFPFFVANAEVSVNSLVVGDDEVDNGAFQVQQSASSAAIPWSELIVLILLGVLIYLGVTSRKRRKKKFDAAVAKAAAEKTAGSSTPETT